MKNTANKANGDQAVLTRREDASEPSATVLESWDAASHRDRAIFSLITFGAMDPQGVSEALGVPIRHIQDVLTRFAQAGGQPLESEMALHKFKAAMFESVATRALLHVTDKKLAEAAPKELAAIAALCHDRASKIREEEPESRPGATGSAYERLVNRQPSPADE